MPRLIIGHVSDSEARIWVRGAKKFPVAFINYGPDDGSPKTEKFLELEERHEFTGVFELSGLAPDTNHSFEIRYAPTPTTPAPNRHRFEPSAGSFKTAPPPGMAREFTFLMVSCNAHSLGIFSSPDPIFRRVGEIIREQRVDFMLHVGDQIYYDIPVPFKLPSLGEYRDKYHDAWGASKPTQAVLAQIPQYMILDDHEIRDNFHNDLVVSVNTVAFLKEIALKAYREYQHIHNPQTFGSAPLYYTFDRAQAGFFVLDARTERYKNPPGNQMIGEEQLSRLFHWLTTHPGRVKFIVTAVPFIGVVRNSDDRWADPPYRSQRDRIIDFIAQNRITNVIFLTGDMHNSYQAQMDIDRTDGQRVTFHELMSSPINHFNKAGPHDYLEPVESFTAVGQNKHKGWILPGTFFGDHSNVMTITVKQDEVHWGIYRARKVQPPEKTGRISLT